MYFVAQGEACPDASTAAPLQRVPGPSLDVSLLVGQLSKAAESATKASFVLWDCHMAMWVPQSMTEEENAADSSVRGSTLIETAHPGPAP